MGEAVAASAGTVMFGIGMMSFAQFGKFRQAGIAMSLSLFFVLCASLTFTPALLRLAGRWAFWPNVRTETIRASGGWLSPTSLMARLIESDWFCAVWDRIGKLLLSRPGTVLAASVAAMIPFAAFGVMNFNFLSYGLLSELPPTNTSRIGAMAVGDHFPAGTTGPVTILVENPKVNFSDRNAGADAIRELTNRLNEHKDDLALADIRSVSHPLGYEGVARVPIFQARESSCGQPIFTSPIATVGKVTSRDWT